MPRYDEWEEPEPAPRYESLVPYQRPEVAEPAEYESGLRPSDLETLRDAMLAIIREDREVFLDSVRVALAERDQHIVVLERELGGVRRVMEGIRAGLSSLEERLRSQRPDPVDPKLWADLVLAEADAGTNGTVDMDRLLEEIGALEALLSSIEGE